MVNRLKFELDVYCSWYHRGMTGEENHCLVIEWMTRQGQRPMGMRGRGLGRSVG